MSEYVELPVETIELDKENPRIAMALQKFNPITAETLALLLGTRSDSCASLKGSIRENKGIIHPIIVNKQSDGKYVVIEGNTRLQIYKDFLTDNEPGDWTKIRAIVYDSLDEDDKHSIRLQAHLIGTREWDPYSKALYLHYLANIEHMPMSTLVSFCGGNAKAAEIRHMIQAYQDMEKYYRPLCNDDTQFDPSRFHGFVELQNKRVLDALTLHGYDKSDFSQWIIDDRLSTLQDVRKLPEILNSSHATEVFLKENSCEAKKILAVEEITIDKLKDVPYELLAQELYKRLVDFSYKELNLLRDDVDYSAKKDSLVDVYYELNEVIKRIGEEDE